MLPAGVDLSLDHQDANLLAELLQVWREKRVRNLLRTVYYDGKAALQDFGISLPPQMRQVESALGWIGKGVNALTDRSVFEGFVAPGGSEDPFELSGVLADNAFDVEFPQAQVSSAVHACSFLTVSRGDVLSGEPEFLVLPRAAEDSGALWDKRRRVLRGFVSVIDTDDSGEWSTVVMYTPEKVFTIRREQSRWTVDVMRNELGVVSVAPLSLKAELKRPFGHSRITRAAMYFADGALRTIVRSELSAELYASPSYWLFGADVSQFVGSDKWTAVMGRMKALDVEPGDEMPELHRFTGESPQPHTDQLRMWASNFAAEMGMAVSSLGIVQDNPSSAEAIYAAKEDLIIDTRQANRGWGRGAVQAAQMVVRLRDGVVDDSEELRRLTAQFTDPAVVSPSAAADAFQKRASAIPNFAETEVGLETAGLTREQIIRYRSEVRGLRVGSLVESLRANADQAVSDPRVAAVVEARGEVEA